MKASSSFALVIIICATLLAGCTHTRIFRDEISPNTFGVIAETTRPFGQVTLDISISDADVDSDKLPSYTISAEKRLKEKTWAYIHVCVNSKYIRKCKVYYRDHHTKLKMESILPKDEPVLNGERLWTYSREVDIALEMLYNCQHLVDPDSC